MNQIYADLWVISKRSSRLTWIDLSLSFASLRRPPWNRPQRLSLEAMSAEILRTLNVKGHLQMVPKVAFDLRFYFVAGAGFEPATSGRHQGRRGYCCFGRETTDSLGVVRDSPSLPVSGYPLGADTGRVFLDRKWTWFETLQVRDEELDRSASNRPHGPSMVPGSDPEFLGADLRSDVIALGCARSEIADCSYTACT
jgi:hypothetical protein